MILLFTLVFALDLGIITRQNVVKQWQYSCFKAIVNLMHDPSISQIIICINSIECGYWKGSGTLLPYMVIRPHPITRCGLHVNVLM